jgi:hypothetical protein
MRLGGSWEVLAAAMVGKADGPMTAKVSRSAHGNFVFRRRAHETLTHEAFAKST